MRVMLAEYARPIVGNALISAEVWYISFSLLITLEFHSL